MNVERNNVCLSWCLIEESYITIKFTDANNDICPMSEYKVLSQRNRPFSLLYRVSLRLALCNYNSYILRSRTLEKFDSFYKVLFENAYLGIPYNVFVILHADIYNLAQFTLSP